MSIEQISSFVGRIAPENKLTTDQATMYSHTIRLQWRAQGLGSWTHTKSVRQFQDAIVLIEAGIESAVQNQRLSERSFRRAGEILEWLAGTDSGVHDKTILRLLASTCYQLANLPAMAFGVSRRETESAPALVAMVSGDFNECLIQVLKTLTSQGNEVETETIENYFENAVVEDILRSFGIISIAFRDGEHERLDLAKNKLRNIVELLKSSSAPLQWLLFRLLEIVIERNWDRSIWSGLNGIRDNLPDRHKPKITSFARGLVKSGRSILWPAQRMGIDKVATGTSFALCTPTGSGKTLVAETAILQCLYTDRSDENALTATNPLIMYLVPSRALAVEVENQLAETFRRIDTNIVVTGLYGGNDWGVAETWLTVERPTVVICTVEKAEALIRYLGSHLTLRLKGVVLDEAHQILTSVEDVMNPEFSPTESRAMRLESFMSRVLTLLPNTRVIALSAVAGGSEHYIAKWASNNVEDTAIKTTERTTRQIIGALECKADGSSTIFLDLLDGKKLGLAFRDGEAYIPQPFPLFPKLKGDFRDIGNHSLCNILWAAIHLSRANRRTLISVTQQIDRVLGRYRKLFEMQTNWIEHCPNFFSIVEGTEVHKVFLDCLVACEDYCGPNSNELYFLRRGIAVHHGQLPLKVRRLMVEVIRKGVTPIVIATSTLTEGVNLPFDVILMPSILRFDGQTQDLIETSEIKNLAGRAGRPGSSGEGIILVGLTVEPTSAPGTKASKKQRDSIRKRRSDYRKLLDLIDGDRDTTDIPNDSVLKSTIDRIFKVWQALFPEQDQTSFLEWLEQTVDIQSAEATENAVDSIDQLVLGSLQEIENFSMNELTIPEAEDQLRRLWSRTYARFQTQNNEFYERVLIARGRAIRNGEHGDNAQRKLLYQIGLPPRQGRLILANLETFETSLLAGEVYAQQDQVERAAFLENIIQTISEVAGFGIDEKYANWRDILRWWLKVENAPEPESEETKDWFDFASDYFEYRVGIFIGASLAKIWNREIQGVFQIPDLDEWKNVTGLPWSAFWIRDLLGWGITEPVVAYMLSMGKTKSRTDAIRHVSAYYEWAETNAIQGDNRINPQNIKRWYDIHFANDHTQGLTFNFEQIILKREFGDLRDTRFRVLPIKSGRFLLWTDPAGYVLAESHLPEVWSERTFLEYDFWLNPSEPSIISQSIYQN